MTNAPRPEAAALRRAQAVTWEHLLEDLHRARNGYWSIAVENDVDLLIELMRASAPTSPDEIPAVLTLSGIYASVLSKAGLDVGEHLSAGLLEAIEVLVNARGMVVPAEWDKTCVQIAAMTL